jgi:hypothetical protein
MQKLCPWEVDVPTTSIGAHKPFGVSSSVIRVLDFLYVKNASRSSGNVSHCFLVFHFTLIFVSIVGQFFGTWVLLMVLYFLLRN